MNFFVGCAGCTGMYSATEQAQVQLNSGRVDRPCQERDEILPVGFEINPVEILADADKLWDRVPHAPRHHRHLWLRPGRAHVIRCEWP